MAKLHYSVILSASTEQLVKLWKDYENLSNYLPDQMPKVVILEENDDEVITEETLLFRTLIKKEIKQKTSHKKNNPDNTLSSTIIEGPAKGTILNILYEKIDSSTKVTVDVDLKISLKYKILTPIIRSWYEWVLSGILKKMNTVALQAEKT